MEPPARLSLQNITRVFDKQTALDDVSLSLQAGQITCLLGPSGCGKSTILRIAAGVDRQTSGSVFLDGDLISNTHTHLPAENRAIGLIFQDFALFPHLTVSANISFGLCRGAACRERVGVLLDKIGLAGHANKYPHQLSGGEQQRVALARALAPRPAIMLMDEPFSGLDNRLRDSLRDATLNVLMDEDTTVLMVTHDPEEAMRTADQIALMRDGRIVQSGAPYNIYNAPIDRAAAAFFSDINVIEGQVSGALTRTPFGDFLTPGYANGQRVEIVIRPQHLRIDFDRQGKGPHPTESDGTPARAAVKRARFLGHQSLVEFVMEADGSTLHATVPGVFLPKVGTALWLSVRRDRCFVFGC